MADLRRLEYDGEYVFPKDFEFTAAHLEGACRLTPVELWKLLVTLTGAFDASHPEWEDPSEEVFERAGGSLIWLLRNRSSWMQGE